MVTPFGADLSVDTDGLRSNVAFLAGSPVDAVICLGSEGEFYALSDDERRLVAEVTADELRGRRPLIVGVTHPSAFVAAALATHAKQIGADAVLATPPYFGQPQLAEISAHFAMIAEAGLPVFVYNSPSRVGYGLSPADLAAIVQVPGDHRRQAGGPGHRRARRASLESRRFRLPSPRRGRGHDLAGPQRWRDGQHGDGRVCDPRAVRSAVGALRERRTAEGLELYRTLAPLREAYSVAGGQAQVVKRLMDRAGLRGGAVRPPARPADGTVDRLLGTLVASLAAEGLWTTLS